MRPIDCTTPADLLTAVRAQQPLVHHITNSVTINDCANITICAGASPVMADYAGEVAEMVSAAGSLVLNIGTVSQEQVDAMLVAGHQANKLGIPIILDPVGVGATRFRTETTWRLLESLEIAIIKGNSGEIGVLAGTDGSVRGVDAIIDPRDPIGTVQECVRLTRTVVAMTGAVDVIADGKHIFLVKNGDPMMNRLSGTGCMAASVSGAFSSVTDDRVVSTAAALSAFGLAGERAAAGGVAGPYSFRTALFDELYRLSPEDFAKNARVEEFYGV